VKLESMEKMGREMAGKRSEGKVEGSRNLVAIDGRNAIFEALRGPRHVEKIYVSRNARRTLSLAKVVSAATSKGVPVVEVSREEIESIANTEVHQGVVALVSPYRYLTLSQLIKEIEGTVNPLVLVLDGIEDPQNFGSLLRVADATGTCGVVIRKKRSCEITPSVVRASAGACEHVRVARVGSIADAVSRLKEAGLFVVGADAGASTEFTGARLDGPAAIVLGSEGKGLERLVRERCDLLVSIPMLGRVESLNVSVAGALLLYEALRQRGFDIRKGRRR